MVAVTLNPTRPKAYPTQAMVADYQAGDPGAREREAAYELARARLALFWGWRIG
jgi:hypothetical protein